MNFGDKSLEDFTGAQLSEIGGTVGYHCAYRLGPTHGCGELCHEVGLDFSRVSVGKCIHILVDGTHRRVEFCCLDGFSQLGTCGFHERRVECATHFQGECTFRSCSLERFAGGSDCFNFAGDYNLAGAVVVGSNDSAGSGGTHFLHFLVGKCDNCLLYTSPSPRDAHESRMPSSA